MTVITLELPYVWSWHNDGASRSPEEGSAGKAKPQPVLSDEAISQWVSWRQGQKSLFPCLSFHRCPWPSSKVWLSCQGKGKPVHCAVGTSVPESLSLRLWLELATLTQETHDHLPWRSPAKLPVTYISEWYNLLLSPSTHPTSSARRSSRLPWGPRKNSPGRRKEAGRKCQGEHRLQK